MAEAGAKEGCSVVVDSAGPVDDLVHAVRVEVSDGEAVGALSAVGGEVSSGMAGVEGPALGELSVAPVPGCEDGAGVVAAAHDDARLFAVEIGESGDEAIDAVAVAVSPSGYGSAGRDVVGGGEGGAGGSVKDGEKLGAF